MKNIFTNNFLLFLKILMVSIIGMILNLCVNLNLLRYIFILDEPKTYNEHIKIKVMKRKKLFASKIKLFFS